MKFSAENLCKMLLIFFFFGSGATWKVKCEL